jgi:hypothetical protein
MQHSQALAPSATDSSTSLPNEMGGYVADLQLHMALQARNLLPGLNSSAVLDSRLELLHNVQAAAEKTASRQWI